jgi:hypothetical protein
MNVLSVQFVHTSSVDFRDLEEGLEIAGSGLSFEALSCLAMMLSGTIKDERTRMSMSTSRRGVQSTDAPHLVIESPVTARNNFRICPSAWPYASASSLWESCWNLGTVLSLRSHLTHTPDGHRPSTLPDLNIRFYHP